MKTIIIVLIVSWIIYKTKVINCFVNSCYIPDAPPAPDAIAPPSPYEQLKKDREQLENDAYYILYKQNYKYPETVRTMGDEMLKRIIRDYLDI